MDPNLLRMLAVDSIPRSVLSLENVGKSLGRKLGVHGERPVSTPSARKEEEKLDVQKPAMHVAYQLQTKGGATFFDGEVPMFLVDNSLTQGTAKGVQARHCVVLTEHRVLKVENWQVTQAVNLCDIVSAENKGESTFSALTKVLVRLFDGRQEVIHLHKRNAAQWLCSLLGRIGHINERRELKSSALQGSEGAHCTTSEIPSPGADQSRRRKFRVLIRRSAKWEHAVVILEPSEIRIVKLILADTRSQKKCKRINGRIIQKWDEVPIRTRRYSDMAWVRLPDLKSVVFGFYSGERYAVHSSQAPALRQAVSRRRARERHQRRCRLFTRICHSSSVSRDQPASSLTPSTLQRDSPIKTRLAFPESPTKISALDTKSGTSEPNLSQKFDSSSPPPPDHQAPSPPTRENISSSPAKSSHPLVYHPRQRRSPLSEASEKLIELFVEQVVLDKRSAPGQIRASFLRRALTVTSAGKTAAASLAQPTRKAIRRISGMVLSSLEALGRRRDSELNAGHGRKRSSGKAEAARRFLKLLPRRLAAADSGRDDEWDELCVVVERTVQGLLVPPLSADIMRAFESLPDIREKDKIYATRAKRLRLKGQTHFGIEPESPGRWSLAVFELSSLDRTAVACPWEKLEVLLNTAHAIQMEHSVITTQTPENASKEHSKEQSLTCIDIEDTKIKSLGGSDGERPPECEVRGNNIDSENTEDPASTVAGEIQAESKSQIESQRKPSLDEESKTGTGEKAEMTPEQFKQASLSADMFFPIWVYVLVNAPLRRPYAWLHYIRVLGAGADGNYCGIMSGEAGYYLTMFEAGLEYISHFDKEFCNETEPSIS
mmetsp:Transcript_1747/g.4057  ORF Transcript_1747/g.4057 Transcript_1747/m.4057 type:complete len:831 (-) Transcript_1747:171-2663(-)|eukprot:CAMPEP_0114498288 /NCGR_PEP_ID=MMETSP0109-20121206/6797_1 /TAXON_ID=29199 /ORGANISM="Chlorarachnion reptans, Strain CCCM449" /LENGTH=830 /DNA_ID=CAMNT_0001675765 /DNA_START=532 /DNA_END=3024 /DNA_ORIENTATION=+